MQQPSEVIPIVRPLHRKRDDLIAEPEGIEQRHQLVHRVVEPHAALPFAEGDGAAVGLYLHEINLQTPARSAQAFEHDDIVLRVLLQVPPGRMEAAPPGPDDHYIGGIGQ